MVSKLYAGVVVSDLERARAWYAAVFGRDADATPMGGLCEWHVGDNVLQVVDLETVRRIQQLPDWGSAGASSVTLVVDDLETPTARAEPVSHFEGPRFDTVSVRDPDGNLVTFLRPATA